MNEYRLIIPLQPITKKNHQQILRAGNGRSFIAQSKTYREYEKNAVASVKWAYDRIASPVNVKTIYYMGTRRLVDLVNLQEATLDVLVRAGVLKDDNRDIVASMDGSYVDYDKSYPRTEIIITPLPEYTQWKEVVDERRSMES